MKPTPQQLSHCVEQLTRFIPTPPRREPKQQQSKWGVRNGTRLGRDDGQEFLVIECDSEGITIEPTTGLGTMPATTIRVESKESLATFTPIKMVRKRKVHPTLPLSSYDIEPTDIK